MFFSDVIFISVALAMDAFALTVANCTTYKKSLTTSLEWAMPSAFALFQFLMPVIGFYLGTTFSSALSSCAGFITAAIFFVLGLKIVLDNVKEMREEKIVGDETATFNVKILLIQAVATSIDALLIGAGSFAFKLSAPFLSSLIVGAITFVIVSLALFFGKFLGEKLGKYAEWTGAGILFVLAIKEFVIALI